MRAFRGQVTIGVLPPLWDIQLAQYGSSLGVMKKDLKSLFKSFSIELPVYAVLVVAYFFLVLHFLGGWLYHLFKEERRWYAITALVLIIAQGFVLEILTRALLRFIRGNRE